MTQGGRSVAPSGGEALTGCYGMAAESVKIEPSCLSPLPSDYDNIGEYYFESDHVAIRGNRDYQSLLRNIAILEAQKATAIQDLDRLAEARDEALADPVAFVEKLQRNEDLNLPRPQAIDPVPNIDWDKYSHIARFPALSHHHHHMTRRRPALSKCQTDQLAVPQTALKGYVKKEEAEEGYDNGGGLVVRGRLCNEDKPQTFNQLWTVREQKQLEELLVQFPPEDVEARRWEKIADTLGNRTPQQVASRVQKYFIKLAKAGLPIPGRMPNVTCHSKKVGHRHQRHNRFLFQPSTFFASHEPPVFMSDRDDEDEPSSSAAADLDSEDDDDILPELRDTEEYRELMYLKTAFRRGRVRAYAQHVGFKCDGCEREPILGTRWHCVQCPPPRSVDFCDDCADRGHETPTHGANHRLEAVREARGAYVDGDYTRFRHGDYNYLDPNYMPAN